MADFAESIQRAAVAALKQQIRERFGSIAHPITGERPLVDVRGVRLDEMRITIEGSPEMIAIVSTRMKEDASMSLPAELVERKPPGASPVAFLCHASEDKAIVRRLAGDLRSKGVDVFFDEWEIRPGDSLRQKIEGGLTGCTHFLAVLSPRSIDKPWVNAEIDAGFILKLQNACRFIPLRLELAPSRLSPFLQTLNTPSLDEYDDCLTALVSVIHGIAIKPPLGQAPSVVQQHKAASGLSAAAYALAQLLVSRSEHGRHGDPFLSPEDIRAATHLSDDDIVDAVDELEGEGYVHRQITLGCGAIGFRSVCPTDALFAKYDPLAMPWDAKADALRLAAKLQESKGGLRVQDVADELGWKPRRMNPALDFLISRELVMASEANFHPFRTHSIIALPATRRFLRDHG